MIKLGLYSLMLKNNSAYKFALCIVVVICSSCSHTSTYRMYSPSNYIDYRFVMRRINLFHHDKKKLNPLASSYRKYWGQVIYSRCKNAPSDSEYLSMLSQCNDFYSMFKAIGRMINEQDISQNSSFGPVLFPDRLRWVQMPICENT